MPAKKLRQDMLNKIYVYLIFKWNCFIDLTLEHIKYKLNKTKGIILLEGHGDSSNFGDALNYPFVEYLSGKKVIMSKHLSKKIVQLNASYSVIGSIIQMSNDNCVIWGAGFMSDQKPRVPQPQNIYAVRGPLTRKIFLDHNIDCPEVYGDPALLLPLLYAPKIEKKYKIGFLPHYVDKKSQYLLPYQNIPNVLFIDVQIGRDYKTLIDQMLSCECIVTSSLHGLILSHSYNIPVLLAKYSEKITGGNFKYNDYLLSVNKPHIAPTLIDRHYSLEQYITMMDAQKINFDYKLLLDSCPFICKKAKVEMLEKVVNNS